MNPVWSVKNRGQSGVVRKHFARPAAPSTPRLLSAARVGPVVYGLLQLCCSCSEATDTAVMRLPNLTKLHVHPCHYGAVVHPA